MVPFNLKVLAKFGICSNCSQKLDKARLLVLAKFLLLLACSDSRSNSCMANLSTLGENALVMNASGNMHPGSVCCRFIETEARSNSFRKAPAK